jgi:hypothetical protein
MCVLTNKFHKSSFIGYKVAALFTDGKIYSPATGMLYSTGRVKKIKESTRITDAYVSVFDSPDLINTDYWGCIHKEFYGKTAVFMYKQDAFEYKEFLTNHFKILHPFVERFLNYVVVEMKISNDLYVGTHEDCSIVAGNIIQSIIRLY